MIRILLAIQLGLRVAVVYAVLEAIAQHYGVASQRQPRQRRMVAEVLRDARRDDLAEMIVDLESIDLKPMTPAEVTEAERLLGLAPFKMVMSGYYGGWPFDTIGEDSAN